MKQIVGLDVGKDEEYIVVENYKGSNKSDTTRGTCVLNTTSL